MTLLGFSSNRSFLEQAREFSESDRVKGFASGIFKMYMTIFAFPDLERNWIWKVCKVAKKLDDEEKFDFILSSSPFPSMHIAASRITKRRPCIWIADFRDPWVGNPVYGYGQVREYFEKKLEKKTLLAAKALITVSEDYSDILKSIHNKPIFVIPNGYTIYPETPSNGQESNKTQRIFSHTGNIYRDFHDIRLLIKAVGELKQEGVLSAENFRLNFYGRYEAEITTLVTDLKVTDLVFQIGYVSRRNSIDIQRQSDCLIFFNWEAENQGGLSHLKFYEYLASGTPILTIGRGTTKYTEIIDLENVGFCGFDLISVNSGSRLSIIFSISKA
jgi:glycosyltransferase involved in cell wall biosynthesis